MKPLLTQLLNLPGVDVEEYYDQGDQLILEVEVSSIEATCPRCGQTSTHLHQNHGYLARDLNISGRTVYLKVNRRQFKCSTCGKPFSETLDFIAPRRRQTNRFAEMIVQQVVHSDVHNVALQNDLTDEVVWSIVRAISAKKLTSISDH